jgi:hypothetical protein
VASMRVELDQLKIEMENSGINKSSYAIDELPSFEGYCIYDARSVIEVFYFERGNRYNVQNFVNVIDAINCFKNLVFSDKVLNNANAT